ncbi:MAG: nicotinate (nicotinamide) nucleotide adenylyltransferase [Chitinophagaceae bacterium]
MKIGLYFGSFNPIHNGHLIISQFLLNETDLDKIWLVVSPQNPFKSKKGLLNEYDRLHLIQLAIEGSKNLKASDIEFKLPKPSYTIDTLVYLSEKYPSYQFSVIMGSDSFQNIKEWKNGHLILSNYRIYVYERPDFPLKHNLPENIIAIKAPLLQISSTYIRELIRNNKSIRYLVPEIVKEEIERNGYYKLKGPT